MKKKKKGFTLIELLAVIAILGVVVGLSVTTYSRVRENSLKKDYDNLVSYIETKAAAYAGDTGITTISVGDLIEEGYLQADDQTDIYDPRDNTSLNCYLVTSTYEDEQFVSKISENNVGTDGKCKTYEKTNTYQLCVMKGSTCETLVDENWYSADGGTLTLGVKSGSTRLTKENGYSFNWSSNAGASGTDATITVTVSSIINTLYKVEVDNGSERGDASGYVKIDRQSPSVLDFSVSTDSTGTLGWTKSGRDISVTLTDYSGSGVKAVALIDATKSCTSVTSWIDNSTEKYTFTSKGVGTYNICVKDRVGNISDKNARVTIDKIDTTDPKCTVAVQLGTSLGKASCSDEESDIREIKYALLTNDSTPPAADSPQWKDLSEISYSPSCGNYYYLFVKATNNAGGVYIGQVGNYYYHYPSSCYYPSYPYYPTPTPTPSPSGGVTPSGSGSSSSSSSSSSGTTCDEICQMNKNAADWWSATTDAEREELHTQNEQLAKDYEDRTGNTLTYDDASGEWTDKSGNCVQCGNNKS